VWAIFDGFIFFHIINHFSHGPSGGQASKLAAKVLPTKLVELLPEKDAPDAQKLLQLAVFDTNSQILDLCKRSKLEFGTTAVLAAVCDSSKLIVANVGDSRAVLFRLSSVNGWEPIPLSIDHKPELIEERDRILKESRGQIVERTNNCYRVIPNSEDYPIAEIKAKKLALNMTRSLGHPILSQYGVIPTPEFQTVEIQPKDLLILGSDGIFEIFMHQDISKMLNEFGKQTKETDLTTYICKVITQEATTIQRKNRKALDNITIVAVQFECTLNQA
jgi:serine/threonine protein phosphatase PrpC